ncbi:hypothetical protein BGX34_012192, partial [Mortierella sp. NVP85]
RFASANGVPPAPYETNPSRQAGFEQGGPVRVASPTAHHPYQKPPHLRPHSQSSNGDLRHAAMKDNDYRPFRDQTPPPSGYPRTHTVSNPASSPERFQNDSVFNHRRHASQGYLPGERAGFADSHLETRRDHHGTWSQESTEYDGARMDEEATSRPHSSMMVSPIHPRDERRSIRPSVSESDLHTMEPGSRRERHIRDYHEDDVDEEDVDDIGDEEEFDEEEERMLDQFHRPKHQHRSYGYEDEPEYDRYGPRHPEETPSGHRGPSSQHYPAAHSYEGSSMHRHSRDYSRSGHPQNSPQHPQSYPPRLHQHPHTFQHPGAYQQHQMMGSSSLPTSDPTLTSPRIPSRRGPYLSRSRALRAGLETVPLSSRYQCQYCSKRFSRPSSLRIHTYSHTGERPFKCSEEGCGRQFSVQSNMRRHLRVHRLGRMKNESQD